MVSQISALLNLSNYIIIGCNGNGVFVLKNTTHEITKIDFDFGNCINKILSLGNDMIAIVSTREYKKPRVNIFRLSETNPPRYLGSLKSEQDSQETTADINSNKSIFVSGSYMGMLHSYSLNSYGTFKSLVSIILPKRSCSEIRLVKFHPEIPNLVFVVVGKTIFQYKVSDSGEFHFLAELNEHQDWINSLEFSPDGNILASCSFDPTPTKKRNLIVWSINDFQPAVPRQILEGHTMPVNSVAFSHDGTVLASGASDQTIRIWKKEGNEWICKQVLGGPNYNFINEVVFDSTDPTLLISGSSTGQVVFWRLCDGEWKQNSVQRLL